MKEAKILERIGRGQRVEHFETVRRNRSGELVDVSLTISPIRHSGQTTGASPNSDCGALTRTKLQLKRDRIRIHNQLESLLDDARIRLSGSVSDLLARITSMLVTGRPSRFLFAQGPQLDRGAL